MNFPRLAVTNSTARSAGRYHWVIAWLSIGVAIALLLIGNAIRDYVFVSRVLATQQVHHQMSQIAAQVEQQLRRSGLTPDTLQQVLADTPHPDAAIELHAPNGAPLQRAGPTFPTALFDAQTAHRHPAPNEASYVVLKTPSGELVAEIFPLRATHHAPPRSASPNSATPKPATPKPATPKPATPSPTSSSSAPPDHRPFFLAIALPLKSADTSALTPIRRNLAINLCAALALLATVLLAGIGLRSFVRGRRLEEQIEIARQVQSRLLPSTSIPLPGHQLATLYKPSDQVGGDFYDVFPSPNRGFALVIGDVSGKGIPAALLMGVIHGAVRTASWQSTPAAHEEESRKLNLLLCEHASGNRFASMFWCVYDEQAHTLRYVNAGHCPPFLLTRRNGQLQTTRLDQGGPVLGLLPSATYQATTLDIAPGDLLVMYSDGLVEATNSAGEEFGDNRVATLLQTHANETPTQLRDLLLQTLTTFSPPSDTQDDLTFAILRFNTPT